MKIYAEVLEDTALEQFESAMEQEFVVDGALMPDAHTGYALPIGAVVSTKDVVVPAWVGYDIGCGMCALKLDGISKDSILDNKDEIFDEIYKHIPVGFNVNVCGSNSDDDIYDLTEEGQKIAISKKWSQALGSLGGGNHFIEIGFDENNEVWIVIHSGSRGVGWSIAKHYMKLAKDLNTVVDVVKLESEFTFKNHMWKDKNPDGYEKALSKYIQDYKPKADKMLDGHYALATDSEDGKNYIQDMNWCLDYALANRKEMIERVVAVIRMVLDKPWYEPAWEALINRNHNHADFKDGLWIHRKGATHAEYGMMGVIPGNMKHGSFIVRGKGNPESLYSSSHGAGRVLGRKEANRILNLDVFKDDMKGIKAKIGKDTLDESPDAYKNIFDVMELQKDLVEIVAHVKPIINIKG